MHALSLTPIFSRSNDFKAYTYNSVGFCNLNGLLQPHKFNFKKWLKTKYFRSRMTDRIFSENFPVYLG